MSFVVLSLEQLEQLQARNIFFAGQPVLVRLAEPAPMRLLEPAPRRSLYKTAMCHSWEKTGKCSFGPRCQFAHGPEELRPRPAINDRYKTALCKSWESSGMCPYGDKCGFAHGLHELRRRVIGACLLPQSGSERGAVYVAQPTQHAARPRRLQECVRAGKLP